MVVVKNNVYGAAVIIALPLRKFTQFTWRMTSVAQAPADERWLLNKADQSEL